jgi:hypothetical protein
MNDIYLKFPSKEIATATLEAAPKDPHGYAVDVIGPIYKATGNTVVSVDAETGDSFESPEMKPIDGYHVNVRIIRGEVPEVFSGFVIDPPSTPVRVWA